MMPSKIMLDTGFPSQPGDIADGVGWMWDNPAVPHRSSIRTVRKAPVTVYYVGGTYTNVFGQEGEFPFQYWMWPCLPPELIIRNGSIFPTRTWLDLSRVELVNVPYPGSAFPMNTSIKAGIDYTTALINNIPGNFILAGISQGGSVLSRVYERLTTRRPDLIAGTMWGNTCKQEDRTFTDKVHGRWPDPAPTKSGMWLPNLYKTEDLWWEMFDPDDVVACCENDPQAPNYRRDIYVRKLFNIMMQRYLNVLAVAANPILAYQAYQAIKYNVFSSDENNISPHHRFWSTKPFGSIGDDRTHAEVMIDHINSFGSQPIVGEWHKFEGKRFPIGEGRTITAATESFWVNLGAGSTLSLKINNYDVHGSWIKSSEEIFDTPRYQIDPTLFSLTQRLTPPETTSFSISCEASPRAMDSGIVWFTRPTFEVT